MLFILLSLLSSSTYWYLDHYCKYDNLKVFFKMMALLTLLDQENMIYNSILLSYSIGDVVLNYNEKYSIVFFGMGHLIFVMKMLYAKLTLGLIVCSPIISASSALFYKILRKKNISYFYYITILHLLLITSLVHDYYGQILFILSDLSIGLKIKETEKFEWGLYYLSVLYMRMWFLE